MWQDYAHQTSQYVDRSTGQHIDRSTHRQVLHVVYVATLCTSDRPIGRQADTPTCRHTDRSTSWQGDTLIGGHTVWRNSKKTQRVDIIVFIIWSINKHESIGCVIFLRFLLTGLNIIQCVADPFRINILHIVRVKRHSLDRNLTSSGRRRKSRLRLCQPFLFDDFLKW